MKTKAKKKPVEIKLPKGHSEAEILERLKRLINEMTELSFVISYYGGFNPVKRIVAHYLGVSANHLVELRKSIKVDSLSETARRGFESAAAKLCNKEVICGLVNPAKVRDSSEIRKHNEESLKATMASIRRGQPVQLPKGILGVNAGAVKVIKEATKERKHK